MSPEEIKEMHKAWEMAERKESRTKHEEIQEEYKSDFRGVCDSIVKHFHIAPNVIKNLLPHPFTSSTDAFNGKFGSVSGLILFYRILFEQIGTKFDLKILIKTLQKCIKGRFNLQISIIDPLHPDKPIQTVTIFNWQETVVSKTFGEMIEEKRNKFNKKN